MKKIIIILVLSVFLFGCDKKVYHWEFNYSYEEISQLKIVEIIDELNYREVQQIDLSLAAEVYDDIMNIEMKRYGTNLSSPYGLCFLIVFENGDYDIISQRESKHFKYSDEDILGYNSWLYCNEIEFDELINKYLDDK